MKRTFGAFGIGGAAGLGVATPRHLRENIKSPWLASERL
jgi:hypothetical protein